MYQHLYRFAKHWDRPKKVASRLARSHEIDVIRDLKGLKELRSDWNEIAVANHVEPWQSFSWVEAAALAYSRSHSLRIITVRKNGRLTAVAPLVLKKSQQPLKPLQLHILGGEELKEPNRLISCDPDSLELLAEEIASESTYPIRLSRLANDRSVIQLLLEKFKKHGWVTQVMGMPYPYIDLAGKMIKKSLKNDLRRARKKVRVFGETGFDLICGINEKKLKSHLDTAFRIEASGWKGRNCTAILSNQSRKHFFERYAYSSLRDGTLRLCFLLIDNKAVAVQYAIESMKAYWLLNIGYDEKYRKGSPGNLLLEQSVKTAAQNGLRRYNLLGKEEPWTKRWTKNRKNCLVLAAYRPNLCGVKAMLSDAFFLLQKRFKERLKIRRQKRSRHSKPLFNG